MTQYAGTLLACAVLSLAVAGSAAPPAPARTEIACDTTPLTSSLSLNNPCINDGDSCVQSAAVCRLRGGTVFPLSCGSTGLICCAL